MARFIKVIILVCVCVNFAQAQYGLSGGLDVLKAFGNSKPYVGMHFGGEFPRNDQQSMYARISFYAKQKETINGSTFAQAIDQTVFPNSLTVGYLNSMNYTIIEGGNRYYLGDGYDSGFGVYGGGNFMLVFNSVKRKYDDYDQTKYALSSTELPKGSIFNLGVGISGGVKHTLAGIGTFYLDAGFAYMLVSSASNTTAQSSNLYAPLLFSFNVGFRKDFY